MTDAVTKAIEGSIKKWQKIVDYLSIKNNRAWYIGIIDLEQGEDNCPLCKLYPDKDCNGCPVILKTCRDNCIGSPYIDFHNAWAVRNLKLARREAKAELKFLKSLRK